MQITGGVIHKTEIQTGTSKTGNEWQKMQIVIETKDQYPKTVALDLFGKVVDYGKSLKKDEIITASFDVESREYNGKWYTNVKCWKIESDSNQTSAVAPDPPLPTEETDDLPF